MGERAVIVDMVMGAYGLPIDTPCRDECHSSTAAQCHCTVCHETFSAIGNFDKHRSGGWCLGPASIGLHTNELGVWRAALDERGAARLAARRAERPIVPAGTPGTPQGDQGLYGAIRP